VRAPRRLIALTGATILSAAAIVGCGSGGSSSTSTTSTTARGTSTTGTGGTGTTSRTRTTSPNDQGGAQLQSGPGSPSVNPLGDDNATGAPAEAGIGSTSAAGIVRPFSSRSPWNTPVTGQPVDARSAQWITGAQTRLGVEERGDTTRIERVRRNDGLFINTTKWTTPIVDETNGVRTRVVCRQLIAYCGDGQNVSSLLIPSDQSPLPQYDGWFTVLNRAQGVAYDLWRARRAPGTDVISYQFMRKWDLNGPGFQEPNSVSARGSGLPLFAGEILPEEIASGRIDHALAISVPGPAQRRYVQPASATDGVGDQGSIPEGAHIRLKANVQLHLKVCPAQTAAQKRNNTPPPQNCIQSRTSVRAARAIYNALRTYGAIVVDRSAVPTLYAKQNYDWTQSLKDANGRLLDSDGHALSRFVRDLPNQSTPILRGSEVQQFRLSDFEVVQTTGNLLVFPPTTSAGAASPTAQNPQVQTSSPGVP
jgi:hypothetical protein